MESASASTISADRGFRGTAGLGRAQQFGPLALALFLLATSRWGSYLLGGPPFLADLVLALLVVDRAFAAATGNVLRRGVDAWLALTGGAFLAWSAILLLFSSFDTAALRDAAPYLYVALLFLVVPLNPGAERPASRAVTAALVVHAAWVTLTVAGFTPTSLPSLGGGQAHLFEIRPDIDSTICGLLAAISLNRALLGKATIVNLALAGWGASLVLVGVQTRAGLIALLMQILTLIALAPTRRRALSMVRLQQGYSAARVVARGVNRQLAVAVLVVLVPVTVLVARDTDPVVRLTATLDLVGSSASQGAAEADAAGTASARLNAWGQLIDWITEDTGRNIGGVGMGPNFLEDSGAATLLLGEPGERLSESRHPHNYFLNTWARLGLVGLFLTLAVIGAGFRLAVKVARASPSLSDTDLLAILIVVSFPVIAAFGVIMESPFGAIPYFWALGHLSARACVLQTTDSLAALIGRPHRAALSQHADD